MCKFTVDGAGAGTQGGGGYSNFSAYVGSDPASTVHQKKNIRNFKHPKKIFEILATPKKCPNSVP